MRLYEAKQAHALLAELWPKIKAALAAGHVLILTIERERKTRIQEEKYHAIIGEIARVAAHARKAFAKSRRDRRGGCWHTVAAVHCR